MLFTDPLAINIHKISDSNKNLVGGKASNLGRLCEHQLS